MAQRERRRVLETTRPRLAKEGILHHCPARRPGHRRPEIPGPLFRHHHGTTLDGPRWRRRMELLVQLPPAHPLRESRGGVSCDWRRKAMAQKPKETLVGFLSAL